MYKKRIIIPTLFFQDMNLAEVKEAIINEIMEYHEPKKPLHLDGKFNLRPVRVESQQSKQISNLNSYCRTKLGKKETNVTEFLTLMESQQNNGQLRNVTLDTRLLFKNDLTEIVFNKCDSILRTSQCIYPLWKVVS